MTWLASVPTVLVCGLLLVLPGLPFTYLVGLRRLAAVALAPIVVVGVVAVTAIVASKAGLAWSPLLVLLVSAGLALLLAGVVLPLRGRLPQPAGSDGWPLVGAGAAGILAAMLVGGFTVARAISSPEELIETSDSPFHYNAIVTILESGDASSFTFANLGVPGHPAAFYPAGWHGVTSLLVMLTGASVPAAANIMAATISLVVWPLGCVLLARQLLGPSAVALGLAGLLSVGFGSFPWGLLGWGILWPNLLGIALVPAALAAVLAAVGLARDDVIGRGRAWVMAPVLLVGVGFAHPNAVMSLAAISVPPLVVVLATAAARRYRDGDRTAAALLVAPLVLAGPAYWLLVTRSGLFAGFVGADSPPFESPSQAVGEVLTGATNGRGAGWVLAGLVIAGIVITFRQRTHRWLSVSHAVSGGLYVLAAGVPGAERRILTGLWYTDSARLAAMLPITGIPLAVIALVAAIGLVRSRLVAPRVRWAAPVTAAVSTAAVLALVLALTGGLNSTDNRNRVLAAYPKVDPLVDRDEYALFTRVEEHVEPGATIAQMPVNGSPAVMALTRRQVLFPQINTGRATPDQWYLAGHLRDASTDPRVCEAADRLDVRYLLADSETRGERWGGLDRPPPGPGFTLLDEGGDFRLYEITACDDGSTDRAAS